MTFAARAVVTIAFLTIGAAFIALSATLFLEFPHQLAFSLATSDSQLFLFFPLLGIMALVAFHRPAWVLLDLYWCYVRYGRWMVSIGLILIVLTSYFFASFLIKTHGPALWRMTAAQLTSDRGAPANCYRPKPEIDARSISRRKLPSDPPTTCDRLSFQDALGNLRQVANRRFSMSAFVRNCEPDLLFKLPDQHFAQHYCFANDRMSTAKECCRSQELFARAADRVINAGSVQSTTKTVYDLLLPFHVFFLFLLFFLGVSLWRRGKLLDEFYDDQCAKIERNVLFGAPVILFWPVLNYSYLTSVSLLFGGGGVSMYRTLAPFFCILFAVWALLLVFFYVRRSEQYVANIGRLAGIGFSLLAALNYDVIIGVTTRIAGTGADHLSLGLLILALVIFFLVTANAKIDVAKVVQGDEAGAAGPTGGAGQG